MKLNEYTRNVFSKAIAYVLTTIHIELSVIFVDVRGVLLVVGFFSLQSWLLNTTTIIDV